MKQFGLIITLLLYFSNLFGQSSIVLDTVYLDAHWKQTSIDNSVYYRIIKKDSNGYFECKDYWITGEIQMIEKLSSLYPETRQGEFVYFYKNGQKRIVANFKDNKNIDPIRKYNSKGLLYLEYVNRIEILDNSKLFKAKIDSFRLYVLRNFKYPESLIKSPIAGVVRIKFYINKNGDVENLKIIHSVDKLLDEEAKRVIKSYKKWTIPIYKGSPTYVELALPVRIKLD